MVASTFCFVAVLQNVRRQKHQSIRKLRAISAFVVVVTAVVVLLQRRPEVQTIKWLDQNKSGCHREGRRSCGLKTIKTKNVLPHCCCTSVGGLKAPQMQNTVNLLLLKMSDSSALLKCFIFYIVLLFIYFFNVLLLCFWSETGNKSWLIG